MRGSQGFKPEMPARAGTEAVGVVEALGDGAATDDDAWRDGVLIVLGARASRQGAAASLTRHLLARSGVRRD